jgi:hypothetical protein
MKSLLDIGKLMGIPNCIPLKNNMLTHKIGVASTFIETIRIMLGAAIATSKMARLASQRGKKDMYRVLTESQSGQR